MQQPAETVNPLDNVPTFELRQRQVGDRRFEVDAAVRALQVVVVSGSKTSIRLLTGPSSPDGLAAEGPGRP